MGNLTIKDFAGEVRSDEEMLAIWQQAEYDVAQAGQTYSAGGGVELTFADIEYIRRMVRYYKKRVLANNGYNGRNYADNNPED